MPKPGEGRGVLWAPWRMGYLKGLKKARRAGRPAACFLCAALKGRDDRASYLVERGRSVSVILNKYPYNNGHVMVIPNRHTSDFSSLSGPERVALMSLTQEYVKVLGKLLSPDGWNLGMNLGRAGGAGLETHLHLHIVPRWGSDTNSLSTISGTRVISQDLDGLWLLLRKARGIR